MKILLHICCANCAVYPAGSLRSEGHQLAGFWFNPNIHPYQEYRSRLDSLKKMGDKWRLDIIYSGGYDPAEFFEMLETADSLNGPITSRESVTPSPERCGSCYSLRLEKTAEQASLRGFDAFTTTLLISPFQNFEQINETGRELADKYNVSFYLRDFRPYFRESMAAAKELGIYRQKYCGCIYSMEERQRKKPENAAAAKKKRSG
ncbi:MAG TPA: epoxyqueuosine reductase QueH [Nitrospirae bacterium]|nr:hypothetical protein BMS3Abin10_00812 [bacterium BMS3Abin10]GBE38354.1 hypothetical protein BMS3Bbin08_00959 [bacterium BMS3Bbin08]HDK16403.1 epoxyqueuosine reductase QueH [Nitrospirota bacterium]HDK80944.1 epoxyqueuosine reductase QueH [Nitrospirota bacterium]HDO25703.1 epoxyqueuosine reductase QueH [Nitrospirota bacterium]